MPGHFDARMQEAVDKAVEKAISKPNDDGPGFATQGEFYKIFKKHDFYDVSDTDNKLTPEQRAQVPVHAQYRYSNFANAIAEMFQFFFNDEDSGILKQLDDIILKLDASATMAKDKTDSIGQSMKIAGAVTSFPGAPNPALIAGNAIMQVKEYLTGFAMGVNPWNPDLISPMSFGIGLPDVSLGVLGNLQQPGFFSPNWDFLYNYESIKSNKFYQTGTGGLKIGCNIDVGEYNEINLKKIFGVVVADTKTTISGNLRGGVQGNDFKIIKSASKLSKSIDDVLDIVKIKNPGGKPVLYVLNDGKDGDVTYDDIRNLTLNTDQIQSSFYELVGLKLWNVIKNRQNWAHGHWGVLTNNALPDYIRTAICSFVWSNGLAIEPGKSDDAALISYLVTIGLYYYIGWQYPVKLMAVPEVDRAYVGGVLREPKNNPLTAGNKNEIQKLPKDEKIAKIYWQWVADFLIRFTSETAGEELGYATRKRRVAEANLIYDGLGHPTYNFFSKENSVILPSYHMEEGLRDRKFDKLLAVLYAHDFYRYGNIGGAGGGGKTQELEPPEPIAKLKYANGAKDKNKLEGSGDGSVVKIIRYLLDKSFVKEATVTRTASTEEAQATAMYNNLNNGNDISYAPPGRRVVNVYVEAKKRLGLGTNIKNGKRIPDSERAHVIADMTREIISVGAANVSRHCGPFNPIAVLDIGPNSVRFHENVFKSSGDKTAQEVGHGHLINTFYKSLQSSENSDTGLVSRFLFPHKYAVYALRTSTDDPAYHIEIEINTEFNTSENAALPEVAFSFKNKNFKTAQARSAPFTNDTVRYKGRANEEYTESIKNTGLDKLDKLKKLTG